MSVLYLTSPMNRPGSLGVIAEIGLKPDAPVGVEVQLVVGGIVREVAEACVDGFA